MQKKEDRKINPAEVALSLFFCMISWEAITKNTIKLTPEKKQRTNKKKEASTFVAGEANKEENDASSSK